MLRGKGESGMLVTDSSDRRVLSNSATIEEWNG